MDISVKIKHINLLVSNRCNLKCKMCDYQLEASKRQELTFEDITGLIDEAAELGLERLELSGGEPMLRADIYQIIEYAKKLKLRTLLVTNGTLIGAGEAKKLVDSGISAVIVSMEGNEVINDFIRGAGSYKKAMNAVYSLLEYKEKLDYVNIGITVSKANYCDLYSFTRQLFEEVDISGISYNPFDGEMLEEESYEAVRDIFNITPDLCSALKQELEKIIKYSNEKRVNISPDYYLRKMPDYFEGKSIKLVFPCTEPITGCAVNSSGELFPCWGQQSMSMGNITDSSFEALISSDKYKEACKNGLTLKCKGCLKACYVNIHSNIF